MKHYCKNTDATDYEIIKTAMHKCLNGKLKRTDVREFLLNGDNRPGKKLEYNEKARTDFEYLDELISKQARVLRTEIIREDLILKPVKYDIRKDGNSGKKRNIATESIKQQCYDYIALECLTPFFAYIGEYQIAGIKGRGTSYGIKAISKWLKDPKCKYAGKCDIKKCYESINKDMLMLFLYEHVRNDKLLWLIRTLIDTYKQGLSIGSVLSQCLCTLYLAQLYHEISERMFRVRQCRNGMTKRIRLVSHVLFQMDDILVIGRNKRDVETTMIGIRVYLLKMGLKLKERPQVFKIRCGGKKAVNGERFIDIIGYRFYGHKVKLSLRRRTYKKLRRCYLRAKRKGIDIQRARRFISLYGRLKHTNYYKVKSLYNKIFKICKGVVSSYDKSKICRRAVACYN